MFSITFTKDQAEQFIHGIFQKNFINVPEFIVRISDEEGDLEMKKYLKELSSEVNPWLTPDENGWFTHDPDWKSEECPPYIAEDRKVVVILSGAIKESHPHYPDSWHWSVDKDTGDIIKWKYAD